MSGESPKLYRWKLVVEYDGTDFVGWSRQPGHRSVQGAIEACLEQILQHPVTLSVSGRTDAGVHARGQVAAFSTHKVREPKRVTLSLNGLLPPDVAIVHSELMPESFEPRFWSRSKCYKYFWLERPSRSPIRRAGVWHIHQRLDVDSMNKAALVLLGEHDFSSFRASGCQSKNAVRKIKDIAVQRHGDCVVLEVHGHGFLRHMVRIIAGTLFEVGRGRQSPDWVRVILTGKDRTKGGQTAPACGLFLESIVYGDGLPEWHQTEE